MELYHNGSIKADDEVCSGNGYWFFVREDDLVQRFLLNGEVQGFNPISEAKNVLTREPTIKGPSGEEEDITLVGGIDFTEIRTQEKTPETFQLISQTQSVEAIKKEDFSLKVSSPQEDKKKIDVNNSSKKTALKTNKNPLRKQEWLKYISVVGFIFLFCLIYFRKSIMRYIFNSDITLISINFINSAQAQVNSPDKKKSFLKAPLSWKI